MILKYLFLLSLVLNEKVVQSQDVEDKSSDEYELTNDTDYPLSDDNATIIDDIHDDHSSDDLCQLCICTLSPNLPLYVDCFNIQLQQIPESLTNLDENESLTL